MRTTDERRAANRQCHQARTTLRKRLGRCVRCNQPKAPTDPTACCAACRQTARAASRRNYQLRCQVGR